MLPTVCVYISALYIPCHLLFCKSMDLDLFCEVCLYYQKCRALEILCLNPLENVCVCVHISMRKGYFYVCINVYSFDIYIILAPVFRDGSGPFTDNLLTAC